MIRDNKADDKHRRAYGAATPRAISELSVTKRFAQSILMVVSARVVWCVHLMVYV
jgi:hypothetical protein